MLVLWFSTNKKLREVWYSISSNWQGKWSFININVDITSCILSQSRNEKFMTDHTQLSKSNKNKKHSENADTSTSVTFDLDVWPWPYFKYKKVYVIRCRLLYCALVPGMITVLVIVCEIWQLIHFCDLWPSPVTFSLCQGHFHSNQ